MLEDIGGCWRILEDVGGGVSCSAQIGQIGLLQDTVGFDHVDAHVTDVMITWIGDVMEQTCKQLLGSVGSHWAHVKLDHQQCYSR